MPEFDLDTAEFNRLNARLLGIAYRMLGSWADAEEVAATTWLRWQEKRPADLQDAQAWLTTVATRLSVDLLRTARRQRESYIGPWLPEPVDELALLPHESVEQRQSLAFGLLYLMERLTPDERAVYVLRHAFDHPYPQIAQMLGRTPAACRQAGSRAQTKLGRGVPAVEAPPSSATIRRLLQQLTQAVSEGEVARAVALITDDAVLVTDGGGVVKAAINLIHGPTKMVRFLMGVQAKANFEVTETSVNGEPALLLTAAEESRLLHVEIGAGDPPRIIQIHVQGNPDKLRSWRDLSR